MIYKIIPLSNCKFCHGTSEVAEHHLYGSTYVTEYLVCDCVLEQLPEDYDDGKDDFEIDLSNLPDDRPEFEYDDYLDKEF